MGFSLASNLINSAKWVNGFYGEFESMQIAQMGISLIVLQGTKNRI